MIAERIEIHDLLNAALLGFVLLVMGYGILWGVDELQATTSDGLINSEKEVGADGAPDVIDVSGDDAGADNLRPVSQILVRVANGTDSAEASEAATEVLAAGGYQTLPPRDAATVADTLVWYTDGFKAEAERLAGTLDVALQNVLPVPSSSEVEIGEAHIVVLIGTNSSF